MLEKDLVIGKSVRCVCTFSVGAFEYVFFFSRIINLCLFVLDVNIHS